MRILITGSAGFIGFHLSRYFLERGDYVYGIDNFQSDKKLCNKRNNILKKSKKYSFKKFDLSKKNNFFKNIRFDFIIHLAAMPGVRLSMKDPFKCVKSNIDAFLNILEFAKKRKIKNIFYASSSTVYGEESKNFTENKITKYPKSIYAITKISNEMMANVYHAEYSINFIGLRFFSIYGKFGRPDMSYYKFLNDIKKNGKIILNGNGEIKRSFTHINDAIHAISRIIAKYNKLKKFNEIYNIGNSKSIKILQIIKIIKDIYPKHFKIIKKKEFSVDNKITKSSNLKIRKSIKYEPKIDISNGLREFIGWFIKN